MNPISKFGLLAPLLQSQDIKGALFDPNKVKKSKQRRYQDLMRGINVYSYSTSERLIQCENKFRCNKLELNNEITSPIVTLEGNIDFAFGRAIETGVQAALLGHPKEKIFFDMFMAWDIKLMAEHPRGAEKRFVDACIAIDQFIYIKEQIMQGWQIAMFNGKPAIELALCVDMENGYYFVGHADVILYHPVLQRFRVLEIKTTGRKFLHEAMYKNSGQSTGYSIFLDEIAKNVELTSTYEVYYLVFPTSVGYWKIYEFTKARSSRAEWINTLLLDIQRIQNYKKLNYWPKRGNSCFEWNRPCEYFDRCDLSNDSFNPKGEFAWITPEEINKHEFDFRFKMSDIIATQKELIR